MAAYDYEAQNDGELSFEEGDRIEVVARSDDGWWEGRLKGAVGLFPSNYIEDEESDEEE